MASKMKMSSALPKGVDRLKEEHRKVINNRLSPVRDVCAGFWRILHVRLRLEEVIALVLSSSTIKLDDLHGSDPLLFLDCSKLSRAFLVAEVATWEDDANASPDLFQPVSSMGMTKVLIVSLSCIFNTYLFKHESTMPLFQTSFHILETKSKVMRC